MLPFSLSYPLSLPESKQQDDSEDSELFAQGPAKSDSIATQADVPFHVQPHTNHGWCFHNLQVMVVIQQRRSSSTASFNFSVLAKHGCGLPSVQHMNKAQRVFAASYAQVSRSFCAFNNTKWLGRVAYALI